MKRLEIERIEALGEMDVYDIQTESGEYLSTTCACTTASSSPSTTRWTGSSTGTGRKASSSRAAPVPASTCRTSGRRKEHLQGGGTASGPVSFMRGADASAGTIKSGGKTRRAAKMVILDADHPDIEEFIWCKAIEERKARALRDAGFDMDLDGSDSHSIQYQNANNSVRVTDEFMQAVVDDARLGPQGGHRRRAGARRCKARDLMRQIPQAAWECADPGMQYDTTINRWHTASNTGRINGSNPCFPGTALVHTDKGLIRFARARRPRARGETFGIYTHDATNPDAPAERARDHATRRGDDHRLQRDREAPVLERHGAALHAGPQDLHDESRLRRGEAT